MSLYELRSEFRAVELELEQLENDQVDDAEALFNRLRLIELEGDQKGAAVVVWIRNLEAESEMFSAEAKRLAAVAKARQNRADSLRAYLLEWMQATGKDKLKCLAGTASVLAPKERVLVHPDAVLEWPAETYEHAVAQGAVVEKREIKSSVLKKIFPETWMRLKGVKIEKGEPSITIR